jgi:hypothetical protein
MPVTVNWARTKNLMERNSPNPFRLPSEVGIYKSLKRKEAKMPQ